MKMHRVNIKAYIYVVIGILICISSISFAANKRFEIGKAGPIEKSATLPNTIQNVQQVLKHSSQVFISESYGFVKEAWAPKAKDDDSLLLIHIQDAHCNYEAQNNIASIMDELMESYPDQIKLVAVEGSVGVIDTSPFAEFSDNEIKKEVADYFMQKGKITGPELLAITKDHDFAIYGIEKQELYDKNYKAFVDSLPFREASERYCDDLARVLSLLKHHIYEEELKKYDQKMNDYEAGEMAFLDYVTVLQEWAKANQVELESWANFNILQKVQQAEKEIDFKVVEKERQRLIDGLGRILPKEALSELVLKSLNFKTGKLNAVDYYEYLAGLVIKTSAANKIPQAELGVAWSEENYRLDKKDYSNLFSYIDYLQLNEKMDKTKLFEECAEIEKRIAEVLFQNDKQRTLYQLAHNLEMLRKMFKLELVKTDYEYYEKHTEDFKVAKLLSFIKVEAPRLGIDFVANEDIYEIDDKLSVVELFYETALARDDVIIENTLDELKRNNLNVAVLITGGFHTPGLTQIMKDKDIAYVVASPKITKRPEYNPYIDVMMNKKTPFEQFLEQIQE